MQALGYLNSLDAPAMFTPGDNDWTDCDRPANGGFNSLERLDHERQLFFTTPYSLGEHTVKQEVQTDADLPRLSPSSAGRPCVENRRWSVKDVIYATLNVQGSCNNLCDTAPDPAEYRGPQRRGHRLAARRPSPRRRRNGVGRGDDHRAGRSRLRPHRRDARAAPRPDRRSSRPTGAAGRLSRLPGRAARPDRSPSASRSPTCTATRTTSASTSRSSTRAAGAWRTSRASRPSATTRERQQRRALGEGARRPDSRDVFAFQAQIVPANRTAVPAP